MILSISLFAAAAIAQTPNEGPLSLHYRCDHPPVNGIHYALSIEVEGKQNRFVLNDARKESPDVFSVENGVLTVSKIQSQGAIAYRYRLRDRTNRGKYFVVTARDGSENVSASAELTYVDKSHKITTGCIRLPTFGAFSQ